MFMLTTSQIDEYLVAFQSQRSKPPSPRTLQGYRQDLHQLVARSVPLEPAALERFVSFRQDGQPYAPASRNRLLAAVRGLTQFLVVEGALDSDPTKELENAEVPEEDRVLPTLGQIERAFSFLHGRALTWRRLRDEALFLMLFHLGLRVSELCSLQLEQVNLENLVLTQVQRKGGKYKDAPLNIEAAFGLASWLSCRPDTPGLTEVFVGSKGTLKPLSERAVQRLLKSLRQQADIPVPLTPHVFRHVLTEMRSEDGTEPFTIQRLLSHGSVKTTMHYLNTSLSRQRRELERNPRLLLKDGQGMEALAAA